MNIVLNEKIVILTTMYKTNFGNCYSCKIKGFCIFKTRYILHNKKSCLYKGLNFQINKI